ncbi:MAG: hypothetical protein ACREQ1_05370, partial [Woeseiaceae bacterium]
GRLLAMFLLERENAYTPIPGLLHEYERIGVDASHRQMDRITASVRLARQAVREVLGVRGAYGKVIPLEIVHAKLGEAHASGELTVDDGLARDLIAGLGPAIRLIQGDGASGPVLQRTSFAGGASGAGRLITLGGAGIPN